MELIMGLVIGVGLSAACGFRVFVPLLGMSIASMSGHLTLAPGFEWIGSWVALVAFATAAVVEIAAFYVPVVDNAMDTLALPAVVVAGTVMTASQIVEFSPLVRWSLAIIAGGGVGAVIQGGTMAHRAASTVTTLAAGNPIIATLELVASVALTALVIALPVVCLVFVVGTFCVMIGRIVRWRGARQRPAAAGH